MYDSDGLRSSHMHIENSRGVSIDNSDVELSDFVIYNNERSSGH